MSPVNEFTTAGKRKLGKDDRIAFKIDGEPYSLIRPKQSVLARAALALESGVSMDDQRNVRIMLGFVSEIVGHVDETPSDENGLHGRARLEQRLGDATDSLDLEQLLPIMTSLLDGWFKRPTGSPRASTASPRRTATVRKAPAGRASRARTR